MTDPVWYYAFYNKAPDPTPFYDRTFGCKTAADQWVAKDPANRFIALKGTLPDDFYS